MVLQNMQLLPLEIFILCIFGPPIVVLSAQSYYATLAHESVHWTRHPSRLDRSFEQQRYGDGGYAREELVAELGAAFLCADLGRLIADRFSSMRRRQSTGKRAAVIG
jgi:antirestriction protein ArdC